jgi:MULE transposase domain
MRLENPDLALTAQDIRNQRYRSRLEFLDGRTPIQALLIALMDDEGTWTTNYKAEDDVVSAVFCIHKTSLALLRAHSYILVMDCTYKTNKYKMPLLDIVGITSLNTSFYVGFCFVAKEDFNHYEFALRCLDEIYYLTWPIPEQ